MTESLIHYSSARIKRVRSVKQVAEPEMKPRGFWISVDDGYGWREWCEAEQFGLSGLVVEHEIILAPDAEILRLASPGDIDDFTAEFRDTGVAKYSYFHMNWQRVAERWQGLIIAPYQWDRRLDASCNWYYGWDCSSGCLWDAAAVKKIRPKASPNQGTTE